MFQLALNHFIIVIFTLFFYFVFLKPLVRYAIKTIVYSYYEKYGVFKYVTIEVYNDNKKISTEDDLIFDDYQCLAYEPAEKEHIFEVIFGNGIHQRKQRFICKDNPEAISLKEKEVNHQLQRLMSRYVHVNKIKRSSNAEDRNFIKYKTIKKMIDFFS